MRSATCDQPGSERDLLVHCRVREARGAVHARLLGERFEGEGGHRQSLNL